MNRSILLLLALAVALAGCAEKTTTPPANDADDGGATSDGTTDDQGEEAPRQATFTAAEYSFSGPDAVAAGWVTLTLDNVGAEWHEMVLLPIPEGKTFADFQAMLDADMGMDSEGSADDTNMTGHAGDNLTGDDNMTGDAGDDEEPPVGGIGAIIGGAQNTVTMKLAEGGYIIACWIPAPDGAPHAFKGMIAQLNVTAAPANAEPTGEDVTITVEDGNATISPAFTPGNHTVKAVNPGTDAESDGSGVQFVKLDEGVTAREFGAYFMDEANATGPPPGRPWGGLTYLPAGETAFFEVDLVPGDYAILSIDHGFRAIAEFTVA